MSQHRCPGQNTQFWGPADIFALACPHCRANIEFFKDDAKRECPTCGKVVFNPRINMGCALWCPKAEDCLGPEQYAGIMQTKGHSEQRRADMERLIAMVPDEDVNLRRLFKQLFLENKDLSRLIDTDKLNRLRETEPELFEKAITIFGEFRKQTDSSKQ